MQPLCCRNFCDRTLGTVPLELIQFLPDLRLFDAGSDQLVFVSQTVLEPTSEQLVKGFVVHLFRGVVFSDSRKRVQNALFDILGTVVVLPQDIKPIAQLGEGIGIANRQIDFKIWSLATA